MNEFNRDYWSERWKNSETQWDVGYPSTPLKEYIDQLTNKNMHILVPGAGNAYEGIYLLEQGFSNTIILDIAPEPIEELKRKIPQKWHKNLILDDFFKHIGQYDLILEQTFFCALHPSLRRTYVDKCYELLNPGGKIVGLLFNTEFNSDFPPFGGHLAEYNQLFDRRFQVHMKEAYNSIKPREGRELFVKFVKK